MLGLPVVCIFMRLFAIAACLLYLSITIEKAKSVILISLLWLVAAVLSVIALR